MEIHYINDVVFRTSSGEYTHTVGLLKAWRLKRPLKYYSPVSNKKLISKAGLSDLTRFIAWSDIPILGRLIYYVFIILKFFNYSRNQRKVCLYIRESGLSILLLPLIRKHKFVLEVNGIRDIEITGKPLKKLYFSICKPLYSILLKESQIVAVSKGVKQFLIDKYKIESNQVIVINNGSDIITSNKQDFGGPPRLIFIGNFSKWQGFHMLLKAAELHKPDLLKMGLTILMFGGGPEEASWKASSKERNLEDLIQFKGPISRADLCRAFRKNDIGVLLDSRNYNGLFPFSPLKYYDYIALSMPTIHLTETNFNDSLPNCIRANSTDLVEAIRICTTQIYPVKPRNWLDVAQELESCFGS